MTGYARSNHQKESLRAGPHRNCARAGRQPRGLPDRNRL